MATKILYSQPQMMQLKRGTGDSLGIRQTSPNNLHICFTTLPWVDSSGLRTHLHATKSLVITKQAKKMFLPARWKKKQKHLLSVLATRRHLICVFWSGKKGSYSEKRKRRKNYVTHITKHASCTNILRVLIISTALKIYHVLLYSRACRGIKGGTYTKTSKHTGKEDLFHRKCIRDTGVSVTWLMNTIQGRRQLCQYSVLINKAHQWPTLPSPFSEKGYRVELTVLIYTVKPHGKTRLVECTYCRKLDNARDKKALVSSIPIRRKGKERNPTPSCGPDLHYRGVIRQNHLVLPVAAAY
mgnify:CR=1 FL=1